MVIRPLYSLLFPILQMKRAIALLAFPDAFK
jgi:hypothetical protein